MKCLVSINEVASSKVASFTVEAEPSVEHPHGIVQAIREDMPTTAKRIVEIVADEDEFQVHSSLLWVDAPSEMPNEAGAEKDWYYDSTDSTIKSKNNASHPYPDPYVAP